MGYRLQLVAQSVGYVILTDEKHGSALLADVNWGNVNISLVDWGQVTRGGDELEARHART
jgi:hypothetical protein